MIEEQPKVTQDAPGEHDRGAEQVLQARLEDGERVEVFADALMREAHHLFEKCKVALTNRRLIVLKPTWPWGFKVDRVLPRSGCSIRKFKQRFDGSHLVLVQADEGVTGLYFSRSWQEQALQIINSLPHAERV